eukprot:TRINITY_DN16675_c0_g1_i6.p1 TRINITY_DN16675_c0_g1~~TRINITY_DN16675_c0_g1_i6.p1  ORF type:complete len:752 (-),score=162.71 TRINITY_DN16675_c0_g1_i6:79-2085(-)
MSPSVRLSRLSINSPKVNSVSEKHSERSPLRTVNEQVGDKNKLAVTKRRSLFSPQKGLDDCEIADMLFDTKSDDKASPKVVKIDVVTKDDGVFKKPVGVVKTPVKLNLSPRQELISPGKRLNHDKIEDMLFSPEKPVANCSPPKMTKVAGILGGKWNGRRESPLKINNSDDLEALLCSPIKDPSPVKLVSAQPAPPPENNLPTRSPRKPVTPMKSPRKAAANLFSSPVKSQGGGGGGSIAPPPGPPKVDLTKIHMAKTALHTGTPDELLCRAQQVETMSQWLDQHLLQKKPGSLYVSGAPGTGKTATLTHLLNNKKAKYKSIFLNCMVLKSSIAIFKEVAKQLNPKSGAKTEKEALKEIEKYTTGKGDVVLLVLDEIDQLDSKNQDVLYTIFEWPALPNSRLSLIGIANTLDLTDRVLPRLQIKECYRPTLIHYPPYTKPQIVEIISTRLAKCGIEKDVVTQRAIAFLAGKISTLSGDIRKALDVCRRALELAEMSARKQMMKPVTSRGLGSPMTSPQKGYKNPRPVTAKVGQVDLPQIMKVINDVYGSKVMSSMGTTGKGLPTQQKILMASLLLLVKRGTSKEVTLGKLVQTYTKVCKKKGMVASDELECIGMVQGLEDRRMLTFQCKSGAPRYGKVILRLDENEVMIALEDKTLLSSIVDDVSCLE